MSIRPVDEREAVAERYAEHLTDTDLLTLAGGRREQAAALPAQPSLVLDILDRLDVLGLVEVARLQRATGLRLRSAEGPVTGLLEELAARAYERVGDAVPPDVVSAPGTARRVLTLVADRYLFPLAPDWLAAPGA